MWARLKLKCNLSRWWARTRLHINCSRKLSSFLIRLTEKERKMCQLQHLSSSKNVLTEWPCSRCVVYGPWECGHTKGKLSPVHSNLSHHYDKELWGKQQSTKLLRSLFSATMWKTLQRHLTSRTHIHCFSALPIQLYVNSPDTPHPNATRKREEISLRDGFYRLNIR